MPKISKKSAIQQLSYRPGKLNDNFLCLQMKMGTQFFTIVYHCSGRTAPGYRPAQRSPRRGLADGLSEPPRIPGRQPVPSGGGTPGKTRSDLVEVTKKNYRAAALLGFCPIPGRRACRQKALAFPDHGRDWSRSSGNNLDLPHGLIHICDFLFHALVRSIYFVC
jgi:hypothetical protein